MKRVIVILLFICFPVSTPAAGWTKISQLRPTQFRLGMEEARKKQEILAEMSKLGRRKYLKENPVPVIKGPNDELFIVDHHHQTRAAWEAREDEVYTEVTRDWSDLSLDDFWDKMRKKGLVCLIDENGEDTLDPKHLPKTVWGLADDPYRTLAWEVRKRGAFRKVTKKENENVYHAENKWAAFFRSRIALWSTPEQKEEAIRQGIQLAIEDPQARSLPGFIGEDAWENCRSALVELGK